MKIISLGNPFVQSAITTFPSVLLDSAGNLEDVDIYLIQPETLRTELVHGAENIADFSANSKTPLSERAFRLKEVLFKKRLSKVQEVLSQGSIAFVALNGRLPDVKLLVKVNRLLDVSDSSWLWPFTEITLTSNVGSGMVWENLSPNSPLNEITLADHYYGNQIVSKVGFPLLRIPSKLPNVNQFAGWITPIGKGFICYLPWDIAKHLNTRTIEVFASEIRSLAESVKIPSIKPAWLNNVSDRFDAAKIERLRVLSAQRTAINQEENEVTDDLQLTDWKYGLLYQTDRELEQTVVKSFTEMGILVFPGPHSHADFVGRIGSVLFFGEVKGVDGAAKVNAISQMQNWRLELERALYDEEATADPILVEYRKVLEKLDCLDADGRVGEDFTLKGVLIINTFHETALSDRPNLSERTNENFPSTFHAKLTGLDLAAMTSVQLLGILVSEDDRLSIWHEVLETVGVLTKFRDYSQFLNI
jgi:hypothetical protein